MAEFGWIDFSAEQENVFKSILNALRQKGVVDELGIGTIRNRISDLLFPAVSTNHTRARYFILTAQIIKEYEKKYFNKQKSLPSLKEYLRKREIEIMLDFANNYEEGNGIIGITVAKTKKELTIKPSSIYWSSLRMLNIINSPNNRTEYLRAFETKNKSETISTKEEKDDKSAGFIDLFGIKMPDFKQIEVENITIELSIEEATYLKEKFIDLEYKIPNNLLSELMKNELFMRKFISCNTFKEMAEVFLEEDLPEITKRNIKLGKDFDFIVHGAHIRYNCLLNKKNTVYIQKWNAWLSELKKEKEMIIEFDIDDLLSKAESTKTQTKAFIKNWIETISEPIVNTQKLDELIIKQEKDNKKRLARLSAENPNSENKWIGMGEGEESLHYRFKNAKTLVTDIFNGLNI